MKILFLHLSDLHFRNSADINKTAVDEICTEDDAKRYLQRNSVSLLLELYYGTISNA